MFKLKVESLTGQVLQLTQDESNYQVVNIDGLTPPKASINSSIVAGMDGSKFNSSRLEPRNLVITLRLNGNVEQNRINLYKYFRTKQWCKVYYTNGSRDVYIEGYVESMDSDLFSISQRMQISIVCNNPFLQDAQEIVNDISKVLGMFTFPFSFGANGAMYNPDSNTDDAIEFSTYNYERETEIFNDSEDSVGVIIELTFRGVVDDPKIIDTLSGDTFEIKGSYDIGDKIVINTNKSKKSVKLYRNGVESNLFSKLTIGSTWFQLRVGSNLYSYSARRNDSFMRIVYKHHNIYEGV